MSPLKKQIVFSIISALAFAVYTSNNPALSVIHSYDKILNRLEKSGDSERQGENDNEEEERKKVKEIMRFEHDKFPSLDGEWKVKRTTKKRMITPVVSKPISFKHCTLVIPFEKRDFEEREVIITTVGNDLFHIFPKHPVEKNIYTDPNKEKEIVYNNFGFKGVIDGMDLTYAYTIKLDDYYENPTLAKQVWLNGRLEYDKVSSGKIIAKGYEVEYTPECRGFIVDEIEFVMVKTRGRHGKDEGDSLFMQPAYADESYIPEEIQEMDIFPKTMESAEGPSFEPSKDYTPIDTAEPKPGRGKLVPGMW